MRHRDKKVKLPSDHLSLMCNYRAHSCLWIWIWWLCWHLMALVPSRMLFFLTQISCFVLCWCFIAVELWIYLWITYLRNPCIDANFYIKLWMVCRKVIGVSMQPLFLVSLPRRYCGLLGGTAEEFVCFFVAKLWKKKGFLFTSAREVSTETFYWYARCPDEMFVGRINILTSMQTHTNKWVLVMDESLNTGWLRDDYEISLSAS